MLYDVITGLSVLLTVAVTAAVLWSVLAVGIPLRRWLVRELAKDTPERHTTESR